MKVVSAGYEVLSDSDFQHPLRKVERIARICYKSEDRITEDSYRKMTEVLASRKHMAMFEHAGLAFVVSRELYDALERAVKFVTTSAAEESEPMNFCRVRLTRTELGGGNERFIASANIRGWYDFFAKVSESSELLRVRSIRSLYKKVNARLGELFSIEGMEDPMMKTPEFCLYEVTDFGGLITNERLIHETFTAIFTVDRGVTHELVRMRDASFAQESTRYCNYQLGKFGNEITVIRPLFYEEGSDKYNRWYISCLRAEKDYLALLQMGAAPQEARGVLPTCVKSDIAVTANLYEWRHIFNLRACDATGPAHPQMKEVMVPLFDEMRAKYPEILNPIYEESKTRA